MKTKPKKQNNTVKGENRGVNRILIRRIIAAVKRDPLRIDMLYVFNRDDTTAPCGTTACIAGFALALSHPKYFEDRMTWRALISHIARGKFMATGIEEAQERLRLTAHQAHLLFFHDQWPVQFYERFIQAKSRTAEAKVVIARLKFFLRTGK